MRAKLLELRAFLFSSFWFLPIILIISGIVLSFLTVYLDASDGLEIDIPYLSFLEGSVDSYRQMLSTISSSMISLAGVVFSITLVALTLAAGQFGSRVLKNFMKSRLNQIVLGSYLATFTYCLLTLRIIKSDTYISFFPDISIFLALILAIGNIILLIFYIHHISLSIQADTLLKDIYDELAENMKEFFLKKSKSKEENTPSDTESIKVFEKMKLGYTLHTKLMSYSGGYISYINKDKLTKIAEKNDCLIQVLKFTGDFTIQGTPVMELISKKTIKSEILDDIVQCIHTSKTRSPLGDTKFSLQQLVEIAVRGLSPGINDPFTAISSLGRIFSFLGELQYCNLPPSILLDSSDTPRIILKDVTYGEIVELALTQIRHYAKESPFVLRHMYEGLSEISKLPLQKAYKDVIMEHKNKTKELLSHFEKDFIHYSV